MSTASSTTQLRTHGTPSALVIRFATDRCAPWRVWRRTGYLLINDRLQLQYDIDEVRTYFAYANWEELFRVPPGAITFDDFMRQLYLA